MIDYRSSSSRNSIESSSQSELSGRNSSILSQQLRKQVTKLAQINAKIEKQNQFKQMLQNLVPKRHQFSQNTSEYSSQGSSSDLDSIDKDMKQIRQYFGKKQPFSNKDLSKIHNDTTLASFGKATRNKIWERTPVIIINQKGQHDVTRQDRFYQHQQAVLDKTRKRRQNRQQQRIRQLLWKQDIRKQYLKSKQQRQEEQFEERKQIRNQLLRQMQKQQQAKRLINQKNTNNISKRSILQENVCYNLAGKTKRNVKLELCMKALNQGKQRCNNLRQQISQLNFRNIK